MLAQIKGLFAKLSNYPRLRILLIIAAVIVVLVVLMNILSPKGSTTPPSAVQPVSAKRGAPTKTVPPSAAQQYNQLQATNRQQEFQHAVATGNSVFEDSFDNKPAASASTPPANAAPATSPTPAPADTSHAAAQEAKDSQLQKQIDTLQQQLQQQTAQAQVNQVATLENNMNTAISNLTSSWNLPTATTVQGAPAAIPSSSKTAVAGPVIIKAGSIIFGVIDTALNSDQPGTPVMATIVTGPYKGAKLLGAFQAEDDALVVQFNMMSLPNLNRTININAYALDQNTANNALATSVDNHYLLRYGMLFASAFMQGFGNAYQNYNYTCPPGTYNCTLINSNGTPNTQATTTTAAYQGLGQVGTTLSQVAAQQFNTPPTIKVDQGTGIGVLFMSDVSLPTN